MDDIYRAVELMVVASPLFLWVTICLGLLRIIAFWRRFLDRRLSGRRFGAWHG